jgi:uncharacterized membrane protein
MRVLQHYQILLTLATFVNYYRRLNSQKLSNQALWLNDSIAMPMLVARAMNFWTYVVTLGCSFLMAKHSVMNQGSSLAW